MAKKLPLLVLSALLISQAVFAANSDGWVEVTNNDDGVFSVKKGSFNNIKGESSALFMYQTSSKKVEYYKISLKNADCDQGYGNLSFFGMDGRLSFQGDYLSEGSSVGAAIGDFICGVRLAQKTR